LEAWAFRELDEILSTGTDRILEEMLPTYKHSAAFKIHGYESDDALCVMRLRVCRIRREEHVIIGARVKHEICSVSAKVGCGAPSPLLEGQHLVMPHHIVIYHALLRTTKMPNLFLLSDRFFLVKFTFELRVQFSFPSTHLVMHSERSPRLTDARHPFDTLHTILLHAFNGNNDRIETIRYKQRILQNTFPRNFFCNESHSTIPICSITLFPFAALRAQQNCKTTHTYPHSLLSSRLLTPTSSSYSVHLAFQIHPVPAADRPAAVPSSLD
jgi:hypothetical protein